MMMTLSPYVCCISSGDGVSLLLFSVTYKCTCSSVCPMTYTAPTLLDEGAWAVYIVHVSECKLCII